MNWDRVAWSLAKAYPTSKDKKIGWEIAVRALAEILSESDDAPNGYDFIMAVYWRALEPLQNREPKK